MKNRQNIYESITHAAVSDVQYNPQPSTRNNCSTETNISNKDIKSTYKGVDCNNFSDDFGMNVEDLAVIDKWNQSKVPRSPTTSFTTANNIKILIIRNEQSTLPTHFTAKPPVTLPYKGSENKPPLKIRKLIEAETNASEQTSESLSTNPAFKNNACNNYENCVFKNNRIYTYFLDYLKDSSRLEAKNCMYRILMAGKYHNVGYFKYWLWGPFHNFGFYYRGFINNCKGIVSALYEFKYFGNYVSAHSKNFT